MDQQAWLQWLENSLQDEQLDQEERNELRASLTEQAMADEQRAFLRNQSFKLAMQAINSGMTANKVLGWLERVIKIIDNSRPATPKTAVSWFSPGNDCANGIIEQLRLAKKTIDICVFTISDNQLTDQIIAAHQRGVKVRIITDNQKIYDKGNDVHYLIEQGIDVKVDTSTSHMHHKFALFDDIYLLNGSFNWTLSASKYNQEDITLTDNQDFIIAFRRQFDTLWQKFPLYSQIKDR